MSDNFDMCREELKERLRESPRYADPMPDRLMRAMAETLDEASARGTSSGTVASPLKRWMGAVVPVALAASLALGILLGRGGFRPVEDTGGEMPKTVADYIHDVTHDHYLFARLDNALETRQQDPVQLEAWLQQSLHFTPDLPDGSEPFTLEGGRIWHTVNRLSALAAYRLPDGQMAILFAVPAENLAPRGADAESVAGHQVFTGRGWGREARAWYEDDLALALVVPEGHLPPSWSRVFLH